MYCAMHPSSLLMITMKGPLSHMSFGCLALDDDPSTVAECITTNTTFAVGCDIPDAFGCALCIYDRIVILHSTLYCLFYLNVLLFVILHRYILIRIFSYHLLFILR